MASIYRGQWWTTIICCALNNGVLRHMQCLRLFLKSMDQNKSGSVPENQVHYSLSNLGRHNSYRSFQSLDTATIVRFSCITRGNTTIIGSNRFR